MKYERKTRAGKRIAERREEREAEVWDALVSDLNQTEVPEEDRIPFEDVRSGQIRLKDLIHQAFSLKDDTADYDVISSRLDAGGRVSGMNLSILFFAILIASIGLNTNSTAVIIGAMLISPLMGTIQLMGLGIATVNAQKFKKAVVNFLFQVTTALVTSTLYFLISPVKEATNELLGRTAPSVFDIMIATFGGLAGIIALTRKDTTSNVIPGVAIATALMPPLCTCGYSIAGGHWSMLGGAALLFTINTMFILVATVTILIALRMPESANATPELRHRMLSGLVRNATIVLAITILLTVLAAVQNDGFTSHRILEMSTLVL